MSKTTAQVLRDAADLIEPEGAWTQGEYARDRMGAAVEPESSSAVCWCIYGALEKQGNLSDRTHQDATEAVSNLVQELVSVWNDNPDRRQQDVIQALRAAADREEASA